MCKTLVLLMFSRTGSIGKLGQLRIACAEALTALPSSPPATAASSENPATWLRWLKIGIVACRVFLTYAVGNTLCIGVRTVGDFDATQSLLAWTEQTLRLIQNVSRILSTPCARSPGCMRP
jgi:hypothetical protein